MSSRNQYLTPAQRLIAPQLLNTLNTLAEKIKQGEKDFQKLSQEGLQVLSKAGFIAQYLEVLHADTLQIATPHDNNLRILVAACLGDTRLIDNISCQLN
jgi:pantoate--beta-alanine ligase